MTKDEDPNWPQWLVEIYGPAPIGPRKRAKALKADAERKAEIEARLDGLPHAPPDMRPKAPPAREQSAGELRRARIALGIDQPEASAEAAE